MPSSTFDTDHLRDWLERIVAGDNIARDEMIRAALSRLEHLTRRMLRKYPSVARWAETGDVLTASAVRLLRALERTAVADTRGFMNLAAAVIRRELIDLARHFHGPQGLGANHESGDLVAGAPAAAVTDPDPAHLDRWTALHEAAEQLPAEEREVFQLRFYHGWTQERVAELLGFDVRTVRRRWRAACDALTEALGGELPED